MAKRLPLKSGPGLRSLSKRKDLSREKLIAVAIELLDRRGANAITMRALADALQVTPMALYNHFSSKRELLSAVADHLVSSAQFDGRHAGWREQIRHCFHALRELCLRHPALPQLLEGSETAPASVFAPMEVAMQALRKAGLDELQSVRTYYLLVSFTLSQASYQTRGPIPALDPAERVRTGRIAGRGFAAVERLQLPATWDFDASFAFGLDVVLGGIEAVVLDKAVGKRAHLPRLPRRPR